MSHEKKFQKIDPAKATGTEEEILIQFRNVRDAIKSRIEFQQLHSVSP